MVKSETVLVSPSKVNTALTIKVDKTECAPTDWVKISGKLKRQDTGEGLGGKTVSLWVNGIQEATTTTGSDGSYSFNYRIPEEGRYDFYTHFDGDDKFWGCDSPLVTVTAARIPTKITISVSPRTGPPPLEATISGKITDIDGNPIAVKIELYIDGSKVDEKFSNPDGTYSFKYTFTEPRVYEVYTMFPGNVKYEGCERSMMEEEAW